MWPERWKDRFFSRPLIETHVSYSSSKASGFRPAGQNSTAGRRSRVQPNDRAVAEYVGIPDILTWLREPTAEGATPRELAAATGRSIPWVAARIGPRPGEVDERAHRPGLRTAQGGGLHRSRVGRDAVHLVTEYECAPVPASAPPSTIRYSSRMGRSASQDSRISRVPAA